MKFQIVLTTIISFSTFILEKCFISVHFIVDYHQVDLIQKHWFHFSVPLLPQKIL